MMLGGKQVTDHGDNNRSKLFCVVCGQAIFGLFSQQLLTPYITILLTVEVGNIVSQALMTAVKVIQVALSEQLFTTLQSWTAGLSYLTF